MVDNEMIDVEQGIELPPVAGKRVYPWDEMKKDESFIVPFDKKNGASSSLTAYRRRNPDSEKKFASRKMEDGIRFWRTE